MRIVLPCVAASVFALTTVPALAQEPGPSREEIQNEINELRQRLTRLENLLANESESPDEETSPEVQTQPAQEQSLVGSAAPPAPTVNLDAARADNVVAAPLDLALQNPQPRLSFQLQGSTEGKKATVQLSNTLSTTSFDGASEGTGRWSNLTVSASAPLDDSGPTNIGTLSSLDDGFSLNFGFTNFTTVLGKPDTATIAAYQSRARRNCRTQNAGSPNLKKLCDDAEPTTTFLLRYLGGQEFQAYQREFFPRDASWAWGLSAGIGYREFEFLSPLDASEQDQTRLPIQTRAFVSWFPSAGTTSLTGSVAYQRSYKPSDTGALCPMSTAALIQCSVGPIGGPNGRNELILSAELRSYIDLDDGIIPGFGIAPSFNFDAESDEFGVDLPIYLVPDKEGNLTGGIRVGYGSEDDEVVFGVFVGSNFSLSQ